jgi:hypothetical protein
MTKDNSDYGPIIESWVRDFYFSMEEDPEIGDRSGDEPYGVKIIFDGYGYNDETDEHDDTNTFNFAVFVHKDSLTADEFPEHDFQYGLIVHRPEEEVCIHCYIDVDTDMFDYNPFEDSELDDEFVHQLIHDIHQRDTE